MIRRLYCRLTGHDMVATHDVYMKPHSRGESHMLTEQCLRCGHVEREDAWLYVRAHDPEHQD